MVEAFPDVTLVGSKVALTYLKSLAQRPFAEKPVKCVAVTTGTATEHRLTCTSAADVALGASSADLSAPAHRSRHRCLRCYG